MGRKGRKGRGCTESGSGSVRLEKHLAPGDAANLLPTLYLACSG
jgi:hypothetical protein